MTNAPKIDCQVSAVPINRYLVRTKTTKYTHAQKVESVKKRYFVQWGNIASDVLGMVVSPFKTYPAVSWSLASMMFFLRGQEDMAQLIFVMGALTKDTAVESNNTASFSVTVASNSNRLLVMGFGHYQGGDNITGATYNSVALTVIKAQAGSFGERAGLWGLVAPATGANTFAISGNDTWSGYGVLSIYDADQNIPTNVHGVSDDTSEALTTTVDNAWVVAAIGAEPAITMTTTSGVEDMNEQGESYQNAEMHHVLKATAGAQTMSYSLGYGARSNMALCEVKPYVAAGSAVKTYNGLAYASVKTVNGLAIASVKTKNGLA